MGWESGSNRKKRERAVGETLSGRRYDVKYEPIGPNLLLLWRDFNPSSPVGFPLSFARSGDNEGSLHLVGQFVLGRI